MATGYLLDGADPHPLVNSLLLTPMALMPLGSAEIFSNPVALAFPGGERTVPATGSVLRSLPLRQPATHFEISGFIVGNAVGGGDDVTLKLYRAADGINADPVTLATKTIAISGGTASGSELLTRGDFTAEATGTAGVTVTSDATVDLIDAIDLSSTSVGDYIRLPGRTDGIDGGPYFEITAIDDPNDLLEVTPTPSASQTGISWEITGADWGPNWFKKEGWQILGAQA
ncbi:MAG: hypothetical protein IID41_02690, partial [Planctomycetes bacterium]|nr:hypothetical protein [Planctomycetota bacterium]